MSEFLILFGQGVIQPLLSVLFLPVNHAILIETLPVRIPA
jgi:hypothetical protein